MSQLNVKHDRQCERMENFHICHCAKRERLSRGVTTLPTLTIPYPICDGCGRSVYFDGDGYRCDNCHVAWGENPGDNELADHFSDDHDWTDSQGVLHTLEQDVEAWIEREDRKKNLEAHK